MKTITITDACINCNNCVKACPAEILISASNHPKIARIHRCIGCGQCEAVCPQDAITSSFFKEQGTTIPLQEDTIGLLHSLRSVRQYKKEPIPTTDLDQIIQAAYSAPTAQNLRHLKINLYSNQEIEEIMDTTTAYLSKLGQLAHPFIFALARLAGKKTQQFVIEGTTELKEMTNNVKKGDYHIFHKAPHLLVFHDKKKNMFGTDDCNAAMNYARIAAHSLGYGSCIIGYAMVAHKSLEKKLNLPKGHQIYSILCLGAPNISYYKAISRKY